MSFEKLRNWSPNLTHIDPRNEDITTVGSKYVVVSISRYPTYRELRNAGQSIATTRMLGLIQSFQAPQARPIQRFFELGSKYAYSVAGRFQGNIAMSSIMFDAGSNLVGGIYEEVFMEKGTDDVGAEGGILSPTGKELINRPLLYKNGVGPHTYDISQVGGNTTGDMIKKNWGAIRMSIDDNRFDTPFGLCLTMFQSSKRIKASSQADDGLNVNEADDYTYRAMTSLFFEMVKLESYNFDVTASQELIGEFASFFYTGLVNVKTSLQSQTGNTITTVTENP